MLIKGTDVARRCVESKLSTAGLEKCIHSTKYIVKALKCGTTACCCSNTYQFGAIKTWVFVPHSHLVWSSVSIQDRERTLLVQTIKEKLNEMDCTMIQQNDRKKTRKAEVRNHEVRNHDRR